MIIEVGSERYERLFGWRDFQAKFESRLPSYQVLQQALVDPSLKSDAVDMVLEAGRSVGSLRSAGIADLQLGAQMLSYMRVAASRVGGKLALPGNGMLTSMSEGLVQVMTEFKVPVELDSDAVLRVMTDAAFAVGLKALGALGPIGKIAAAVIGAAKAIYDVIKQRQALARIDAKRREQLIYLSLPPLQQPDTEVDAWYVETVLRPLMEAGSWTPIFSPRFDSDRWVGVKRNGGMAFAPGSTSASGIKDEFGDPLRVFSTGAGVGFIPGLDQITSVIQVAGDPAYLEKWSGSGTWPIRPTAVTDVGKFYVNTGRLASIIWSWATAYDATPDIYKIDVGVPGGPGSGHLHARWRRYCDGGLNFLREMADWFQGGGNGNAEKIAGSAIGCAIGAWRCMDDGGGRYRRVDPGWSREDMRSYGLGRGDLGCVVDPASMKAVDQKGGACMITLYDAHIRPVLEQVRARQRYFLWHSLVAAYVRADFDAFRDKVLRDELWRVRAKMLEHPDRKLIQLTDGAEDEPGLPGSGMTWKEQLVKSGVRYRPPFLLQGRRVSGGPQPGTIEPTDEPPPKVPASTAAMPFGELAGAAGDDDAGGDDRESAGSSRKVWWFLGGAALVGAGAVAVHSMRQKQRAETRGER